MEQPTKNGRSSTNTKPHVRLGSASKAPSLTSHRFSNSTSNSSTETSMVPSGLMIPSLASTDSAMASSSHYFLSLSFTSTSPTPHHHLGSLISSSAFIQPISIKISMGVIQERTTQKVASFPRNSKTSFRSMRRRKMD